MDPLLAILFIMFVGAIGIVRAGKSTPVQKQIAAKAMQPPDDGKKYYGTRVRVFTMMTNPNTFCDRLTDFIQTHDIQQRRSEDAPQPVQNSWWVVSRRDDKERAIFATIIYPEEFPFQEIRTMFRIDMIVQYELFTRSLRFEWVVTSGGIIEPRSPLSGAIMEYTIGQVLKLFQIKVDAEVRNMPQVKPIVLRTDTIKFWPSPQEYNEAIQNPSSCFQTEALRRGKAEVTKIGLPRVATGAFASVYKVATADGDCAVKCFLGLTPDLEFRYSLLSGFILTDDLECTVDFDFITEGIHVGSIWYPVLRMVWVEGPPLTRYVEDNLQDSARMTALCNDFAKTVHELRRAGIAHGDLQHGNMLVTADGIRLVDYDGMFVPGMDGMESNEIGHRNYQHPKRKSTNFGPYLDNFSEWVIHLSLKALMAQPELWHQLNGGDECLLLRKTDFDAPDDSQALKLLEASPSEEVRELTGRFREILKAEVDAVPTLNV